MTQSRRTPQINIGAVRWAQGVQTAASVATLRGIREGLAAVAVDRLPAARLNLPALSIRVRAGAGPAEIAEVVRHAVEAAIRQRSGRDDR